MRIKTLLLLLLATAISCLAETELAGLLTSPHLVIEDSPYIVVDDVVVAARDSLVVDPGVEILFPMIANQPASSFTIRGSLIMEGEASNLIYLGPTADSTPGLRNTVFIYVIESALVDFDQRIRMKYVHMDGFSVGLYTDLRQLEEEANSRVERCLFTNGSYGVWLQSEGTHFLHNCIFDNNTVFDVYVQYSNADIRNSVFMPCTSEDEVEGGKVGILWLSSQAVPTDSIQYNCFFDGDGDFTNYIKYSFGATAELVDPDSTNILADPIFLEDPPYYPDTELSPLIDAGDPGMMDPDETIIDIGAFYSTAEAMPFEFTLNTIEDQWVFGFPYARSGGYQGYPIPELELVNAPAGMNLMQQGRSAFRLGWPAGQQSEGSFSFQIVGYNEIEAEAYRDTLSFELNMLENHAPELVRVSPCDGDSIDCITADTLSLTSGHPGELLRIELEFDDPDASILGSAQSYNLNLWRDGILLEPTSGQDTLDYIFDADERRLIYDLSLDTSRVELRVQWDDGLLAAERLIQLQANFSLLGGEVEGLLSADLGPLYILEPLRVPEGATLEIEPGVNLLLGEGLLGDAYVFEIEGELSIQGNEEDPVVFQSLIDLPGINTDENRFGLVHAQRGASITGISNAVFKGFSTAIRLEYLEDPVQIEQCTFEHCLIGVDAVGTQLDLQHCVFSSPQDYHHHGSYFVYLAESEANSIRNCLFVNPIYGVASVGSSVLLANNSFHNSSTVNALGQVNWPSSQYLGFGRVFAFESVVELNSNLFHWKTQLFGVNHDWEDLGTLLETPQHAVWLDESSEVSASYNWYDCVDGFVADTISSMDLTRYLAISDSSLLALNTENGNGDAGFDQDADYRLFSDSPLVNRGDPALGMFDAFDGTRNDIGCYGGPLMDDGGYADELEPESDPGLLPLPRNMSLGEPWPNPFNPETHVSVHLGRTGHLRLAVFNLLGQEVEVLADEVLEAGEYRFRFQAHNLAGGVYFLNAQAVGVSQTRKLLLMR